MHTKNKLKVKVAENNSRPQSDKTPHDTRIDQGKPFLPWLLKYPEVGFLWCGRARLGGHIAGSEINLDLGQPPHQRERRIKTSRGKHPNQPSRQGTRLQLLRKLTSIRFRVSWESAVCVFHVSPKMVKPESGIEATTKEKKAKKKSKCVPDDGGPPETQTEVKKVKKEKKTADSNAASAEDVANGEDVRSGEEKSSIMVSKSKKKKLSEETSSEAGQAPTFVKNGKSKKKKKEKGLDVVEPQAVREIISDVPEQKKTGKKGKALKEGPSAAVSIKTKEESGVEERKKIKKKKKAPKGDESRAEADTGAQEGKVLEDVCCVEVQRNGIEGAADKRKKKSTVKEDGAGDEGKKDKKKRKSSKSSDAEMSLDAESQTGETGAGENGEQLSKKEKKKKRKEKGSGVSGEGVVEEKAEADSSVVEPTEGKPGNRVKKSKKKALSSVAGASDGQNEVAQMEGVLEKKEKKKRKKKEGTAVEAVTSTSLDASGGEVENGGRTKKKKGLSAVKVENGATITDEEMGQDTALIKMEEGEKKRKKEKRKASVKVEEEEAAAEGLNSQEMEGEPKKKKKKKKKNKAELIDGEEQSGPQQATTPKKKKEKQRNGLSSKEKTKKKKVKQECVEEVDIKAEEKKEIAEEGKEGGTPAVNGVKGKKKKSAINSKKRGSEETEKPQKKNKNDRQGEDGEGTLKLRKRKKTKTSEPVKDTAVPQVKSDPEEKAVEVVFISEKMGNMDEVTIDQARRQALQMDIDNESRPKEAEGSSSLGQWSTAQFESSSQQQKFLRLMGGFKKGSQPMGSGEGRANMALGREGQDCLQKNLLADFERAQSRRMDSQNRGAGLGFTAPSNKKFFIDVNARQSFRFDD
ncbi:hypothetical protein GJAV_G00265410 [Gymnothorax javanicus]|nr:hypothetical protein GJAV_G00265410 [Gymnothorax javanicus]